MIAADDEDPRPIRRESQRVGTVFAAASKRLQQDTFIELIVLVRIPGAVQSTAGANKERKILLECKVTKSDNIYLGFKEIDELREFCKKFMGEAYIAFKFSTQEWGFLPLRKLK